MTGDQLIGLALLALLFWVITRSPILRWVLGVSLFLVWGGMVVIAPLFVITQIYLPREQYGASLATLLLGCFLSFFFFAYGVPALLHLLASFRKYLVLWQR